MKRWLANIREGLENIYLIIVCVLFIVFVSGKPNREAKLKAWLKKHESKKR